MGVELLGYRKRLLYGISELRRAHPEWEGHNSLPSKMSPKKKKSPVRPHLLDDVTIVFVYPAIFYLITFAKFRQ